jgi:hypothetical protein
VSIPGVADFYSASLDHPKLDPLLDGIGEGLSVGPRRRSESTDGRGAS